MMCSIHMFVFGLTIISFGFLVHDCFFVSGVTVFSGGMAGIAAGRLVPMVRFKIPKVKNDFTGIRQDRSKGVCGRG